jgi:Ca2+/Na+ antiporter
MLGFSPGILGLTLLAAGTSFPDLVASLIVAKNGSIDMAVSNAFGSNNFDILLCLGLPWCLSIYAVTGRAEMIDTTGILAALFSLIVTTIAWFGYMSATKWVLTPGVGLTMLTTYGTWLICQLILDIFSPEAHE